MIYKCCVSYILWLALHIEKYYQFGCRNNNQGFSNEEFFFAGYIRSCFQRGNLPGQVQQWQLTACFVVRKRKRRIHTSGRSRCRRHWTRASCYMTCASVPWETVREHTVETVILANDQFIVNPYSTWKCFPYKRVKSKYIIPSSISSKI